MNHAFALLRQRQNRSGGRENARKRMRPAVDMPGERRGAKAERREAARSQRVKRPEFTGRLNVLAALANAVKHFL